MGSLLPSGLVDGKFYIDDQIINKPRLLVTYINFSIQESDTGNPDQSRTVALLKMFKNQTHSMTQQYMLTQHM